MFYYFYQICVALFLVQGVSIPFLLALSGWLWWKQNRGLESLRAELKSRAPKGFKPGDISELILKGLPALKPLKCADCGGAVLLREAETFCPYCNVENFRVRFARRERATSENRKTRTKSVLFGATEIIEEFVGTFFFVLLLLTAASVILVIVYAVKNH
jgi:hypothetical protein